MIRRPCASMGCGRLVVPPVRYCDKHQDLERERQAMANAGAAQRWAKYNEANPELRALYGSVRWRKMRAAHLKANPYCTRCPDMATQVDHDPPHDGTAETFYDEGRLQGLCARCHARKTARGRG